MTLKNIVPKEATDKSLLTYVKYLNLKERFNNTYTINDSIDPEQLINDTEFNIPNKRILRPVFDELLRHIRNSGVFLDDEDKSCSYISYILSKDVKSKVGEYKTETFDVFKKFVNKYSKQSNHKTKEVDACNGSLIDSTEDTQDFFQVFKDSKKGIFQTIELI
ncbi:hypothetical protein PVBG_05921 [Plasmodium vivax Brazil I]|uniref:Uncharacterized protein n=1 Tax=Plasmodium vivax (strain Brazil I) TaxID=1033975 RepID=A0A0J9T208_PLAV1|nr:hypothetical protein PVBG_05921 [Plasmodium vivax Brazil I]